MFSFIRALIGAGVALVAPMGVAARAGVPTQFDMLCHGRSTMTAKGIAANPKPASSRMSLDLARRLWCWRDGEACYQVIAIHGVDGNILMLVDDSDARGDSHIRLDLEDGHLMSLVHITRAQEPEVTAALEAHCTMAPYTAIP